MVPDHMHSVSNISGISRVTDTHVTCPSGSEEALQDARRRITEGNYANSQRLPDVPATVYNEGALSPGQSIQSMVGQSMYMSKPQNMSLGSSMFGAGSVHVSMGQSMVGSVQSNIMVPADNDNDPDKEPLTPMSPTDNDNEPLSGYGKPTRGNSVRDSVCPVDPPEPPDLPFDDPSRPISPIPEWRETRRMAEEFEDEDDTSTHDTSELYVDQ